MPVRYNAILHSVHFILCDKTANLNPIKCTYNAV